MISKQINLESSVSFCLNTTLGVHTLGGKHRQDSHDRAQSLRGHAGSSLGTSSHAIEPKRFVRAGMIPRYLLEKVLVLLTEGSHPRARIACLLVLQSCHFLVMLRTTAGRNQRDSSQVPEEAEAKVPCWLIPSSPALDLLQGFVQLTAPFFWLPSKLVPLRLGIVRAVLGTPRWSPPMLSVPRLFLEVTKDAVGISGSGTS